MVLGCKAERSGLSALWLEFRTSGLEFGIPVPYIPRVPGGALIHLHSLQVEHACFHWLVQGPGIEND